MGEVEKEIENIMKLAGINPNVDSASEFKNIRLYEEANRGSDHLYGSGIGLTITFDFTFLDWTQMFDQGIWEEILKFTPDGVQSIGQSTKWSINLPCGPSYLAFDRSMGRSIALRPCGAVGSHRPPHRSAGRSSVILSLDHLSLSPLLLS
ncbi:unnamed protein product [Arabidopsis lyrata]|nr:unnamed protein product [Arabidopsis lyrata]